MKRWDLDEARGTHLLRRDERVLPLNVRLHPRPFGSYQLHPTADSIPPPRFSLCKHRSQCVVVGPLVVRFHLAYEVCRGMVPGEAHRRALPSVRVIRVTKQHHPML